MYGHEISSAMSCPLLNRMFTTLDKVIQANNADEEYVLSLLLSLSL